VRRRTLGSHVASSVWVFLVWTVASGSTLVSPRSSYSIPTDLFVSPLTAMSSPALQFSRYHGEVALVRPGSPYRRPSSRVVNLVSIGPLDKRTWVSGGRRGGSVPVGAASEHREASRDLLVAKEVEQRGLLERFKTRRIVPRIAGEFSLSVGFFFVKPLARACGLSVWAALCLRGPCVAGPWW
jgi:hypothetical protein